MEKLTFVLICHFGLEKVLKNEIKKLGLDIESITDGEIKAIGTVSDIPRLNFNLRTCERVMIEVGYFEAKTFTELFDNVTKLELEKFIPVDGAFPITKANQDKNSLLHSSMSIQSITKKAIVERLKSFYKTDILSEEKSRYPFRVKMHKNFVSLRLDTTGDSLHKRGYRVKSGLAPLEETLASALVKLIDIKDNIIIDPFCGSGTIPIETALICKNLPVGINRAFVSETWKNFLGEPKYINFWNDALKEAKEKIKNDIGNIKIYGFDIDEKMISISKENAKRAGVDDLIIFEKIDVKNLHNQNIVKNDVKKIIITNPPYGERLENKESAKKIYIDFKNAIDNIKNIDINVITSFEDFEKIFGKANKNRKLYNGMIKTYFYNYFCDIKS